MSSDLNSKCRACLSKSNNYHELFDYVEEKYKILEMLDSVVPQIEVKTTPQFSYLLCYSCVEKLLIGYKFQQSCIKAQNRLLDLLEITMFETQSKFKKLSDPLTVESNLQMKEEINNAGFGSDTQRKNFSAGNPPSDNIFSDDSPSSNKCGRMFSSLNRLKQNNGKKDKECVQEPKLLIDCDEKTNDVIGKSSSTVVKQEMALKPQIFDTDLENTGDISKENLKDVDGTDVVEKSKKDKGTFSCEICSKVFDRAHHLQRHKLVHSLSRLHECKICKYRFATANFLKAHLLKHHNGVDGNSQSPAEPFECPDCPRRFERQASLSAHRQTHTRSTSDTNYPCTVCQRSCTTVRSLMEHITNMHPEVERHKCNQCDKTFVLHAHLLEHLNRHRGNKNAVCLICEKEFVYRKNLKEHMRTHSGESPYLCPQCGKTFRSASNLSQHMERHTVLKKYQCPECPSRFKCKSYLVKHAITHSNTKPHVCDICGSRFTRTTSMQKHKLLHSGERPFKCDQCSMTFAVIYHLRRHMRTHTGEKPYKCKYCERAYAESGDLTKHLRTHVGENTYMCDQCPMSFKYQAELREHQSQHFKMAQKLSEK